MGFIYRITHTPTGKKYIGQTQRMPWDRWQAHMNEKRFDDNMRQNIHEYCFQVIVECDKDQLNELEKKYIKEENTLYPNGFNKNEGGNCSIEPKGFLATFMRTTDGRIEPIASKRCKVEWKSVPVSDMFKTKPSKISNIEKVDSNYEPISSKASSAHFMLSSTKEKVLSILMK
jgi:hypothetical protein